MPSQRAGRLANEGNTATIAAEMQLSIYIVCLYRLIMMSAAVESILSPSASSKFFDLTVEVVNAHHRETQYTSPTGFSLLDTRRHT